MKKSPHFPIFVYFVIFFLFLKFGLNGEKISADPDENTSNDSVEIQKIPPKDLSADENPSPSSANPASFSTISKPGHENQPHGGLKSESEKPNIAFLSSKKLAAENLVGFEEWKTKILRENHSSLNSNKQNQRKQLETLHKTKAQTSNMNFASYECGAKILASNPKAKGIHNILNDNRDQYMLSPCSEAKFFVVELCEEVSLVSIQMANYEFFSSTVKDFHVFGSETFPTRDWLLIGKFAAANLPQLQTFLIHDSAISYVKFLKVELLSHHDDEFYCPLSTFRVYGITLLDEFRHFMDNLADSPPDSFPLSQTDALSSAATPSAASTPSPSLPLSASATSTTAFAAPSGAVTLLPSSTLSDPTLVSTSPLQPDLIQDAVKFVKDIVDSVSQIATLDAVAVAVEDSFLAQDSPLVSQKVSQKDSQQDSQQYSQKESNDGLKQADDELASNYTGNFSENVASLSTFVSNGEGIGMGGSQYEEGLGNSSTLLKEPENKSEKNLTNLTNEAEILALDKEKKSHNESEFSDSSSSNFPNLKTNNSTIFLHHDEHQSNLSDPSLLPSLNQAESHVFDQNASEANVDLMQNVQNQNGSRIENQAENQTSHVVETGNEAEPDDLDDDRADDRAPEGEERVESYENEEEDEDEIFRQEIQKKPRIPVFGSASSQSSIFSYLSRQIEELKINATLSALYLEELGNRYSMYLRKAEEILEERFQVLVEEFNSRDEKRERLRTQILSEISSSVERRMEEISRFVSLEIALLEETKYSREYWIRIESLCFLLLMGSTMIGFGLFQSKCYSIASASEALERNSLLKEMKKFQALFPNHFPPSNLNPQTPLPHSTLLEPHFPDKIQTIASLQQESPDRISPQPASDCIPAVDDVCCNPNQGKPSPLAALFSCEEENSSCQSLDSSIDAKDSLPVKNISKKKRKSKISLS